MLLATSEEHRYSTFKLVNTVSDALKLAFQECFGLPTSVLNDFKRDHHSLNHSPRIRQPQITLSEPLSYTDWYNCSARLNITQDVAIYLSPLLGVLPR